MKNQEALLALRDLILQAMDLPPDQEPSADASDAMHAGIDLLFKQGAQAVTNFKTRQPPPPMRSAVLALAPPKDVPCWIIFRQMPAQARNVDITSAKAGYPVTPLNLNAGGRTYKIHVGNNFIPADAWDGAVPAELEAEYTSGTIALYPPGTPAPSEPLLLLWSRARSIAYGLERLSHQDAAAARPAVAAELARIASKIPEGSGELRQSVAKLAAMFAPPAPYKGEKNVSIAEQKRRAARGAEAKRIALLEGEAPADAELAGALATNSFGV
jgi:hypothetical protein